jgi:hypothetical protein
VYVDCECERCCLRTEKYINILWIYYNMGQKNKETSLTLKFKGVEAKLLEEMVRNGLFSSKSEAIRAALIHYFIALGMLGREEQWTEIRSFPKRNVTPEKLAKDLEVLEDEVE